MVVAFEKTKLAGIHRRSIESREDFWGEQAGLIDWFEAPSQVLDYSNPPFARWYVGGKTNICFNAIDRHLSDRADQTALVYISTETNEERCYTFAQLHQEVQTMAAAMQSLGVMRGSRVLIYMPMIAEAIVAMLACVRIGAIHSVVFGGFAAPSLAARIDDAQPVLMVSADAGMRGGKVVPYKHLVDEACRLAQTPPARVLLVNRGIAPLDLVSGRDLEYGPLRTRFARPWCPVSNSWPPIRAISSTPQAPPASPRACSVTPAAMRLPWQRRCVTSTTASRARPCSPPRISAWSWATPTLSMHP